MKVKYFDKIVAYGATVIIPTFLILVLYHPSFSLFNALIFITPRSLFLSSFLYLTIRAIHLSANQDQNIWRWTFGLGAALKEKLLGLLLLLALFGVLEQLVWQFNELNPVWGFILMTPLAFLVLGACIIGLYLFSYAMAVAIHLISGSLETGSSNTIPVKVTIRFALAISLLTAVAAFIYWELFNPVIISFAANAFINIGSILQAGELARWCLLIVLSWGVTGFIISILGVSWRSKTTGTPIKASHKAGVLISIILIFGYLLVERNMSKFQTDNIESAISQYSCYTAPEPSCFAQQISDGKFKANIAVRYLIADKNKQARSILSTLMRMDKRYVLYGGIRYFDFLNIQHAKTLDSYLKATFFVPLVAFKEALNTRELTDVERTEFMHQFKKSFYNKRERLSFRNLTNTPEGNLFQSMMTVMIKLRIPEAAMALRPHTEVVLRGDIEVKLATTLLKYGPEKELKDYLHTFQGTTSAALATSIAQKGLVENVGTGLAEKRRFLVLSLLARQAALAGDKNSALLIESYIPQGTNVSIPKIKERPVASNRVDNPIRRAQQYMREERYEDAWNEIRQVCPLMRLSDYHGKRQKLSLRILSICGRHQEVRQLISTALLSRSGKGDAYVSYEDAADALFDEHEEFLFMKSNLRFNWQIRKRLFP